MSSQNNPLLVILHGGYWRLQHGPEHLTPLADSLRREGWEVETPEYQRKPGDPYLTLESIKSILKNYESREIILGGFSAGGQFALLLASNFSNIKAVIAIAPVTDLVKTEELGLGDNATKEWLPESAINYPDLNPILSKSPSIPTIVIHGDSDLRVPMELSANFVESQRVLGADIKLVQIKDIGHFEIIDPTSSAFPKILSALAALRDA